MKQLLRGISRTAPLPLTALAAPAAAFFLSAAALGGQFSPWTLAAVAVSGTGWSGLASVACALLGALAFLDFQPGLRLGAAALLIFCTNTSFCTTRLYRCGWFRPLAAVLASSLVQTAYLWQRGGRQWALWCASLALLYGCVRLWPQRLGGPAEDSRDGRFLLLLGVCAALSRLSLYGFSPAMLAAAVLLLALSRSARPADLICAGALAGLTLDLCAVDTFYASVVLALAAASCAAARSLPRILSAAAFCAGGLCGAWLLGDVQPFALLCELIAACGAYLLLPAAPLARLPAQDMAAAPAAALQAVYDSLPAEAPALRPENPAVLFDRAAEQVCRDCALRADCWQSHYTDTYNAFNDACPRLLRRGKPLAEDFPAYFAARCIRFPQLLSALEEQLRGFLQRRAHHARLDAAYRLAREQYAQVSQLLTRQEAGDAPARPRYVCRTALATRPKKGEALCGDEAACFAVGDRTYLLLSDGMGSGDSAHHEAAMTVRLLRQFLTAGIHAAPALKTLNTALMLRCQGGAGFTTIDLACMDSASGVVTLYKYGAAPSYLKKSGTVTRLAGSALPAGLESADRDPQPQRLTLSPGHWLVLVSDGVTGDSDEWLQDLLAGWDGTSPRQLVSLILREAEDRWHGDDDCAVLALRAERLGDGKKRV